MIEAGFEASSPHPDTLLHSLPSEWLRARMGSGDTWGEASSLPLRDHGIKVSLLPRSGVAQHIREKLGFRKEQNWKISGYVSIGTPGIASVGLPLWGEPDSVHLLSVCLLKVQIPSRQKLV